ncbi:MAG: hypothetical protein IPK93_10145 [Solirubrobacterales bacterium]|nr:hypothetical protein [Solirubrobacterales bacterium]
MFSKKVMLATVTPLASIFGSGFLIIVPVLEQTLGALSILGVLAVCVLAWFIGTAIRHNVAIVEPLEKEGKQPALDRRMESTGDFVIVIAYVISVALYLRIMSEYVMDFFNGSDSAEKFLASAAIGLITTVGIARGFSGLDLMERLALAAVLVIVTLLGGALFLTDFTTVIGSGISSPPIPDKGLIQILLILGGIVITVQGFETVRYLADEYDPETRILACRLSQVVSTVIYVAFVLAATPAMGLGTADGTDKTLLDITARVVPLFTIPVVITAVLSQFSAATADTVAAQGNLHILVGQQLGKHAAYLVIGVASIVLVWTVPTLAIVALASRAFAAYYGIQCVVALRSSDSVPAKVGFGFLALLMLLITLLAKPAG